MSHLNRSLLLAGALLLTPAAARAATYYISPAGSDTNSGTQASPFRQIRRALQPAAAGDTILVADGTYLGFDVRSKNGSPLAPITIRAVGSGAVVIPTTDRPDNRDTIFITFSSNIVVDGLRAFNGNRAGVRVDQSPRVTIRNGAFGNNGYWGIFTDFSDDLLLEYNECYGSVNEHGIYVSNSGDRPVLRGNVCHDNRASGIQLNADIESGGDGIISGALLENNVCYGNGTGGGAGLNLDGVQDSTVRNNLLFNNHATGIVNYQGNGAEGPRGMVIVHNTVDQPSDGRWCMLIANTTGPNLVRNNILYTRHTYRGSLLYGSPADVANTDSDYNVLGKASPDGDATIYTLSQWQALGNEPHSLDASATALWVDPAKPDYHLKAGSPAVDVGDAANSAPKDLDGTSRPQGLGVDLGCYELPGAPPPADTTPPTAPAGLVATAGNAQISLSWRANTETDLAGYLVYRAAAPEGPYARQNADPLTGTALTETGLTNGATYWYYITAVDQARNESAGSSIVSATPTAPATLVSLAFNPSTVTGGQSSVGTVTLSGPAPAGGAVVSLRSASSKVKVPSSVSIPAGAVSASFTAQTGRVAGKKSITVTAVYNGVTRSATLTLLR